MPDRGGYCWAHLDNTNQDHILAMGNDRVGETYMIWGETYHSADAFQLAGQITGKQNPPRLPYQVFKYMSYLLSGSA